MKKILIYYPEDKFGMSDFREIDYSRIYLRVKNELEGKFPNVGNKVWLQGITSAITTEDCEYHFGYEEVPYDVINREYDCVLLPLANCFHSGWVKYMETRTKHIKNIKIPVYVIACGVQIDSYDDIGKLVSEIKEPATKFIQSVYNTGGEFALRGYITAEFFAKLGFHDAVVTGCPSLYQMGRDLKISNAKVEKDVFKAAINGTFRLPLKKSEFSKCDFIDQGTYGNLLYDPEYFSKTNWSLRRILRDIRRGDYEVLKAIADERIRLFANIQEWMSYYTREQISFSFGSRIHGTVMPILSGVPSLLYACDARTREMAEFFDIPYIMPNEGKTPYDLYDLYCQTDYSKFNQNFAKRFDEYERFLSKCGITKKVNQNNIFMSKEAQIELPESVNKKHFKKLSTLTTSLKPAFDLVELYYQKKTRE